MASTIAFSKWFMKDKGALSEDDQFHLEELVNRIRHDRVRPGDNKEPIKCCSGEHVFSFRINQDVRLAAYLWKPKEYLLLACGHHDALYDRVSRMKLNTVGSTQLPAPIEIAESRTMSAIAEVSVKASFENQLKMVSSDQWRKLGVARELAEQLQIADTEDSLIAVVQTIESPRLRDGVLDIACDIGCFDKTVRSLQSPEDARKDVETILKRNWADRENYFVLTDDKLELYLNGKLENWQVFLHPDQTRGVEMEANGPMMVTGPAGTGKSVVAVHRVKWLLSHPFRVRGRVLLTTFTSTLAEYARELLKTLCTEDEMGRVEVVHFDKFFQDLLRLRCPHTTVCYGDVDFRRPTQYSNLVGAVWTRNRISRSPEFIATEFDRVIAENDICTLEAYQNVVRPKDLGRLSNEARAEIWKTLNDLRMEVKLSRQIPRSAALNKLTAAVAPGDCLFDAIVVDEAQDLGAPEYRLLAKLTGNTYANAVPYSLFFAGDGHQRIYNRTGSLKQCGINVTGRSVRLVKCYRSTKKIREYAEKIIAGISVKDMDEETDSLSGSESLIEGVPPEVNFCHSDEQKFDAMVSAILKWVEQGGKLGDCAVLVRKKIMVEKVVTGLSLRSVNAVGITRDTVSFDSGSVKVMTMHRAKGLQFINVIVDVDGWPQRGVRKAEDNDVSEQLLAQEKCLLYMSVMRAMKNVLITNSHGVNVNVPSDQILV